MKVPYASSGSEVVAEVGRALPPVAAARLQAAGALLESPEKGSVFGRHQIRPRDGESYAQAVLRTIRGMPADQQRRLREMVDWVQDYGFDGLDLPRQGAQRMAVQEIEVAAPADPCGEPEDVFSDEDDDAVAAALASVDEVYARDVMACGG